MYSYAKLKVAAAKPVINIIHKPVPVTYIGPDRALQIPELLQMHGAGRVLVMTDKSLMSLGLLSPILNRLQEAGLYSVVFDEITPDPTFATVSAGMAVCKANTCDSIVAVGGGSVLDTAKAVSVSCANHTDAQSLVGKFKVKKKGITLIAVPTTAGTGSEATMAAVISDPKTHLKATIVDAKIVPAIAVLDPKLTVGLPPHITAATAMDALTHAVEAYVSGYATDETKEYSSVCIKLIYENLLQVYKTPADIEAREALLVASFYGGMAFTRTYVGYVHAFAHNIGGKFGVPHGLANAVLLPHVMRSYLPECTEAFAQLARLTGTATADQPAGEAARLFVDSLEQLNREVGISPMLDQFPRSQVEEIRRLAFQECHGTYPVPRYLTAKEADDILEKIARGN